MTAMPRLAPRQPAARPRTSARIVALAAAIVAFAVPGSVVPAAAQQPPRTQAQVVRVVDGDTIEVEIAGARHSVRYIGVDTPERGHRYWGLARDANAFLVTGRTVLLERDVSETDQYGRLLRYVYLPDAGAGELFVNAELVRHGFAWASTWPPDVRHADLFVALEREARLAGRGLWAVPLAYLPAVGRVGWCVDLNTASREELQLIIHIGPARADQIIAGRPWRSVDDLIRVSGIGEARLADIKREGLACVRGGGRE